MLTNPRDAFRGQTRSAERIDFKLALVVYKCQHGAAPSYFADEPVCPWTVTLDVVYDPPRHHC